MSDNSVHDYSDLASTYDELRYVTPEQQFVDDVRFQAVKQCLNPTPSMHLIDVGTGTGAGSSSLPLLSGRWLGSMERLQCLSVRRPRRRTFN